jgi:hypothetical protein
MLLPNRKLGKSFIIGNWKISSSIRLGRYLICKKSRNIYWVLRLWKVSI